MPAVEDVSQGEEIVREIIDRITAGPIDAVERALSGVDSVTVGGSPYLISTRNSYSGEPIAKATQYGFEFFRSHGLEAYYHDYSWDGHEWRNVCARQTGSVNPNDIVIICAHIDDMPGAGAAPGADDNGSGTAAVLLAASILKEYTFENTILYVLFTGEEQGLRGSAAFVAQRGWAPGRVIGAVNLDMIAYSRDGNPVIDIQCGDGESSGRLGDLLMDTISRHSIPLEPRKFTDPSQTASDHASFWDAGYAAILGIEDEREAYFNPHYHTVDDTWAHCDAAFAANFTKAAVGTLARLAVPAGTAQAEIELNGSLFEAGDSFSSRFVLKRPIEPPFTAYAAIFLPDGSMVDATTLGPVAPAAVSVPGLHPPFEYRLYSGAVPRGAPKGQYEVVAAFFDPSSEITGRGDAFLEASKGFEIR